MLAQSWWITIHKSQDTVGNVPRQCIACGPVTFQLRLSANSLKVLVGRIGTFSKPLSATMCAQESLSRRSAGHQFARIAALSLANVTLKRELLDDHVS